MPKELSAWTSYSVKPSNSAATSVRVGGRAYARNLRLRKPQVPLRPVAEIPGPPSQTAHQASLHLDAQFPWLAAAFVHRPTLKARLKA
jgi:hypothetical protein